MKIILITAVVILGDTRFERDQHKDEFWMYENRRKILPPIDATETALEDWADRIIEKPYIFTERPAAKSSTSILISTPGAIACPKCGCRSLGANAAQAVLCRKKGCGCDCHGSA